MTETPSTEPNKSDIWIQHASGGDPYLETYMLAKEELMEAERESRVDTASFRQHVQELNGMIVARQREIGIDPLTGPDVTYDKQP